MQMMIHTHTHTHTHTRTGKDCRTLLTSLKISIPQTLLTHAQTHTYIYVHTYHIMVTLVYWVSGIHCEGCCNFMLTRGSSKEVFFFCFLSPGPRWTEVGLNNRCGTKAVQRGEVGEIDSFWLADSTCFCCLVKLVSHCANSQVPNVNAKRWLSSWVEPHIAPSISL